MKKANFNKIKMECITHCDKCGKKIVFAPFYRDVLNTVICRKCYRGLK